MIHLRVDASRRIGHSEPLIAHREVKNNDTSDYGKFHSTSEETVYKGLQLRQIVRLVSISILYASNIVRKLININPLG